MPYILRAVITTLGVGFLSYVTHVVFLLLGNKELANLFNVIALTVICVFAVLAAAVGVYFTLRPAVPRTMVYDLMYLGYAAFSDVPLELEMDNLGFCSIKVTNKKEVMYTTPMPHLRQLFTYKVGSFIFYGSGKKKSTYHINSGKTNDGFIKTDNHLYVNTVLGEEIFYAIEKERAAYASGDFKKNPETIYPLASYIFAETDFIKGRNEVDMKRVRIFYENATSLQVVYRLRGMSNEAVENLAALPESYVEQIVSG